MDQVFAFIGGHWWLVFPLGAALAAIGRATQRALADRHRRRLEILKAKTELKAVEVQRRSVATSSEPKPITKPAPVPTQLDRLFSAHDAVTTRWLEYELDGAKLNAFPAMSDGRQPLTAAFLRAKKVADRLRPASSQVKLDADQVAEYRTAVTDYEVAFEVAEREARRIRDSSFTETERKRLATAQQLLTIAVDEAATPAERQLAYRRVREELDGLIDVSDEAIVILEKKVALELPASPSADPPVTS